MKESDGKEDGGGFNRNAFRNRKTRNFIRQHGGVVNVSDFPPVASHACLRPALHFCPLVHGTALRMLLHHGVLRPQSAGHHGAGRTAAGRAERGVSLLRHPCGDKSPGMSSLHRKEIIDSVIN